jgi:hypothetical protein
MELQWLLFLSLMFGFGVSERDLVYALGLKPKIEGDFCSDGRIVLSENNY